MVCLSPPDVALTVTRGRDGPFKANGPRRRLWISDWAAWSDNQSHTAGTDAHRRTPARRERIRFRLEQHADEWRSRRRSPTAPAEDPSTGTATALVRPYRHGSGRARRISESIRSSDSSAALPRRCSQGVRHEAETQSLRAPQEKPRQCFAVEQRRTAGRIARHCIAESPGINAQRRLEDAMSEAASGASGAHRRYGISTSAASRRNLGDSSTFLTA